MHTLKSYFNQQNIVRAISVFFIIYAIIVFALHIIYSYAIFNSSQINIIALVYSGLVTPPLFIGLVVMLPIAFLSSISPILVVIFLIILLALFFIALIYSYFNFPITSVPWFRIAISVWFFLILFQTMNFTFDSWCEFKGTCVSHRYDIEGAKNLDVAVKFQKEFPEHQFLEENVHGSFLRIYANEKKQTYLDIPLKNEEPVLYCMQRSAMNNLDLYTSQSAIHIALDQGYCQ